VPEKSNSINKIIHKTLIGNDKKCFLSSKSAFTVIMISEGSCDTEDWNNDAENSALP